VKISTKLVPIYSYQIKQSTPHIIIGTQPTHNM